MLGMLLAYYFYPPTRHWLDGLAEIKAHWSYGYTAISSIIAGAFIDRSPALEDNILHDAKIAVQ